MYYGYGIVTLLVLILDIWVIMQILNGSGDGTKKLIWIIIVLVLPLVGPILWLLLGRGTV